MKYAKVLTCLAATLIAIWTLTGGKSPVSFRSPTPDELKTCVAVEALKDSPEESREEFEYLMNFQEGYEDSALGHETVMYPWKVNGARLCRKLVLLNEPIPVPRFRRSTGHEVACDVKSDTACGKRW